MRAFPWEYPVLPGSLNSFGWPSHVSLWTCWGQDDTDVQVRQGVFLEEWIQIVERGFRPSAAGRDCEMVSKSEKIGPRGIEERC